MRGMDPPTTIALLDALDKAEKSLRVMAAALEPFGSPQVFNTESPCDQGLALRLATKREKPLLKASDFRTAARVLAAYRAAQSDRPGDRKGTDA